MAEKILITGGAGFLGSHLCDRILKDRTAEQLICFDNLQTGSLENVSHLKNNNSFDFQHGDVINDYDFDVSEIWNLACAASPEKYQLDPIHTFKTSVDGALNAGQLAIKNGAKLFHTSTSEVYGDALISPQSEDYWGNVNPVGIRSCYDEGKRSAETVLFDLHRRNAFNLKVVRIFNTYGPRMAIDDGRVVSNFIVQALCGEDITIYGDGQQTRSFCYVDDLIDAFIHVFNLPLDFQGPVNIGNPVEFTILELAELVLNVVGSKSKIVFKALPQDDPKQRRPDITLVKEKSGWEPKVNLEDGVKETVGFFKLKLAI
jgi:UDP-glucuronate decarboxylase